MSDQSFSQESGGFLFRIKNILRPPESKNPYPSGFIFKEDVLKEIREKVGQKIPVVVDINGVLCTTSKPLRLNPHAKEVLEALHNDPHVYLVIWSSSTEKIVKALKKMGLDLSQYADLIITREYYERNNTEQRRLSNQAVELCPWLNSAEKEVIIYPDINNPTGPTPSLKTPQVLFPQCLWIEDFGPAIKALFPCDDETQQGRYDILPVKIFGQDGLTPNYPNFDLGIIGQVKVFLEKAFVYQKKS